MYIKYNIKQAAKQLDGALGYGTNYDILKRDMVIGGKETVLYMIDGFTADDYVQKLMQFFCGLTEDKMPDTAEGMTEKQVPAGEVKRADKVDDIVKDILSGQLCMLVDGYSEAILIDSREYPARSVSEPEKDKTMRGAKDCFVETLVFNSAMLRRRVRTTALRLCAMEIGRRSRTDVVLCYIEDKVDHKVLDKVRGKLESISIDALTMSQESLAECMHKGTWLNPFPKVKYTERPDTVAASILEGSIIILVDNSPQAMILPASLFDIMEEANDYYFPPVTGTYLRLSRIMINIVTLLLTPLFLLSLQYPDVLPGWLNFVRMKEAVNVPVIWQLLILEFAVDGMKMAAINTPNMLSMPLSVIAGLVIGEFAVSSGWFNSEPMLYMAFVTVANYSQVSFELGYALKFMRILILILTAIFGIWGFAGGVLITILSVAFNRSITGRSYLYPLIPFNGKQLLRRFFRISLPRTEK